MLALSSTDMFPLMRYQWTSGTKHEIYAMFYQDFNTKTQKDALILGLAFTMCHYHIPFSNIPAGQTSFEVKIAAETPASCKGKIPDLKLGKTFLKRCRQKCVHVSLSLSLVMPYLAFL